MLNRQPHHWFTYFIGIEVIISKVEEEEDIQRIQKYNRQCFKYISTSTYASIYV